MINITTVAGVIIFLALLAVILNNIRKKGIDALSLFLLFIDILLILMIVFQDLTYQMINALGFSRPEIAFLSIISITAFFFAVKSYFNQKELEKDVTELAREIALKNKK